MCACAHTYTIIDVYVSIILATLRTQTSSQPLTDKHNNLSAVAVTHLLLLDVRIKKLVLDKILCYVFNNTDVTGQIVTEPLAAPTLLVVIADRNTSIW
jgi:hypothetical protein